MKTPYGKCAYVHCFVHRNVYKFGIFGVLGDVYYLIFYVYLFLVLA